MDFWQAFKKAYEFLAGFLKKAYIKNPYFL